MEVASEDQIAFGWAYGYYFNTSLIPISGVAKGEGRRGLWPPGGPRGLPRGLRGAPRAPKRASKGPRRPDEAL